MGVKRISALALMLFSVNWCSDALVYGERGSFNIAIHINDDPSLTIIANTGFRRYVATSVPAIGGSDDKTGLARGEALSSIRGLFLISTEARVC